MADLLEELLAQPPDLPPVILDRSTIEAYASCPWKGWCIEHGVVHTGGPAADAGNEVHDAIGQAVGEYALAGAKVTDLVEVMEAAALMSRPDVQPDAIDGLKRSIWNIAKYVCDRHPLDILRYDGGPTAFDDPRSGEVIDRSGQLSWDIMPATKTRGAVRLTSEVDLLAAGAAVDELAETDWKSGRTQWSATDVANSFQFRMHAWLVFRNYPDAQRLFTRVWMTRMGQATGWVLFDRSVMAEFEGQALAAVQERESVCRAVAAAMGDSDAGGGSKAAIERPATREQFVASVMRHGGEAWPGVDKCGLCPAWWCCPACVRPVADMQADPSRYAADTSAMEQAVAERKKLLRSYVDEHGDIDGRVCFGLGAPRSPRKPSAAQYTFYDPPEG